VSVSRLRKEQRHTWLTVDAGTVRLIRHSDALAVWILLLNSPDDWIVRRAWLQKELGIGSTRLRSAIARLEGLGLWERRPLRNAQGRLCGTEIVIREIPVPPPSVQVSRHSVILDTRETSTVGEMPPYQETKEVPRKESNTKPAARGDGKDPAAHSSAVKLSFAREFGFDWSAAHAHLLSESRAVAILRHERASKTQAKPGASWPSGRQWLPEALAAILRPRWCGPAAIIWRRQWPATSGCRYGHRINETAALTSNPTLPINP